MKLTVLFLFVFSASFVGQAQTNGTTCICDTTFRKFAPETTRQDSINWKSIDCYYQKRRISGEPMSVVNYQNGMKHGEYATYHRKAHWLFVKQRGYQQAIPRNRRRIRDFYRREGKSLFGKSEHGNYINGKKDGVWHTFDTNQRIVSSVTWKADEELEPGLTCNGIHDVLGFDYRTDFDEIMSTVKTAANGEHIHKVDGKNAIYYTVLDFQLNGEMKIMKNTKKPYLRSTHSFDNNCLSELSITFSMTGDTTRIETDYLYGVPYKIVSYTPSSRGTAYYRDPTYSYELNSEYRNGLIVERREKVARAK